METNVDSPESGTLLGMAKRMNNDLEDVPLASHAAIVGVLTTLLQHRADVERGKQIEAQRKAQIEQAFAPGPLVMARQ